MRDVYITGGLRSPVGVYKGQWKSVKPEILGATVLMELVRRGIVRETEVDGIMLGNAVGTGGNIARLTALTAGWPERIPAMTIDMQCASAGAAVILAAAKIRSGLSDCLVAGGIESASLQPLRTYADGDDRTGDYIVAQFAPGENDSAAMLKGAARVSERFGFSRETLDELALESHRKADAEEARAAVRRYMTDGEDEGIRSNMSMRLLSRMPNLLGADVPITAGNACLTHDGAAAVVLSSEKGSFRIVGMREWAGEPLESPLGAMEATEAVLRTCDMHMEDMDAVEWNEAFAVISALFYRRYPSCVKVYNRLGGALAYGHPYGASGAIILLHLMAALELVGGRYGVAAIAGAGGTGTAMIIERV